MCFMEGQGVDGHVGYDILCPCSALNVKLVRNSKQARTNDRSNHDPLCKVARCVAFC